MIRTPASHVLCMALVIVLVASLAGCSSLKNLGQAEPQDARTPLSDAPGLTAAVMGDTIGGVAYLRGTRWIAVRGYGLVVGLGRNGSRDCPEPLRTQMLQEMTKRMQTGGIYASQKVELSAANLLDSLDTAVVEVNGLVPPGACQGARFDVHVITVAGTQTHSLEGGRLYTCDLRMYRFDSSGGALEGRTIAVASGPIFLPGAGDPDAKADLREGLVLGGGENLTPRAMELVLSTASHRYAREITNRVNERFGGGRKLAEALNPSVIRVQAPASWRGNEGHFYEMVMHLPLARQEEYLSRRARTLIPMLTRPHAPAEDIALVLEAMDQPAVPAVREFYADPSRAVRYYCARVGLRLRDDMAVEVLAREAAEAGSPFREAAVAELSNASDVPVARLPLRELLNDRDTKIRILAYEGLSKHRDENIRRHQVGQASFTLEVVESRGEPLIYATRTLEPRLAVIGQGVTCRPPVFYMHPQHIVTISADPGQHQVTLVRRAQSGPASEAMKVSCDLGELLRFLGDTAEPIADTTQVKGLGLLYSQVLDIVSVLCRSRAIAASLEFQQQLPSDSLGAIRPAIRPESEIQAPALPMATQPQDAQAAPEGPLRPERPEQ